MNTPRTAPLLSSLLAALLLAWTPATIAQSASPQQRVDTLKKWLAASRQSIRQYEWVQTSTVTVDGKTQKKQQFHCYYGVDGKLQKVQVGDDGSTEKGMKIMLPPAMILSKIAEHRAQEVQEFAASAEQLVHSYLPTDPAKIQASVNAGKMSLNPAGQRVKLGFADYLKAGDNLAVEMEIPTSRLIAVSVESYLDKPEDAVQFDAQMGVLPDGTIYASHITLSAPSKKLNIVIDNSGHRPASS